MNTAVFIMALFQALVTLAGLGVFVGPATEAFQIVAFTQALVLGTLALGGVLDRVGVDR